MQLSNVLMQETAFFYRSEIVEKLCKIQLYKYIYLERWGWELTQGSTFSSALAYVTAFF